MQHENSDPANSRKRFDFAAIQFEVISPNLPSRVKKRNELAGFHIKSAYLTCFMAITVET